MTYNPNSSGTPTISRASGPASVNNTGVTLAKATPVRLNSNGMATIDVSEESQVDGIAGVTRSALANGASGDIVASGLLENITTSFAVGSAVYIGKDGGLTDQKPTLGANSFEAGDFVVRVGVITKNAGNPANKDLLVNIQNVGML